ncbi:DUF1254 domain-containing protein [Algivirga pacifica]|uniref:DUF1254 domain-containing protein n=1 Tax=Algivirga pacifica TaxID=1162670 RepID=A0ABP9DE89_9BACT
MKTLVSVLFVLVFLGCNQKSSDKTEEQNQEAKEVTAENFIRAETDNMFAQMIGNAGGTNQFFHFRTPTPLDKQTVIRMNRDVLYSGGVFDAREGLEITFPEMPDDRYASIYILDNDHYVEEIIYEPGDYTVESKTDFVYIIVRIQVYNADDTEEIKMVNDLQDQFIVKSVSNQEFPDFSWDKSSLDSLRAVYNAESAQYESWEGMQGKRGEVNEETRHIAAAAAWGLLPEEAATYLNYKPKDTKENVCYTATYEVPDNTGFWSITVYGDDGYIKTENCLLNGSNVKLNKDSTFTVHFGSEETCGDVPNRLDAPEGWNFLFRVYRPGNSVLDGTFKLPEVEAKK